MSSILRHSSWQLAAGAALSVFAAPSAMAQQCGNPDAGPCCEVHDAPYCSNPECCEAVCELDPFCCSQSWDEYCVDIAEAICE